MSPAAHQQHTFPAVPRSLSAGDHETRDYYAEQDSPRPATNQTPYLTPYLGLRARLSQIWINRWTILLLLVLVRTLMAIASVDDNLSSARAKALSACTSVESMGSAMASMPHYMSQGVNELAASGVEKAVGGLMSMLQLSVTAIEEIVIFVINLLTSTYVCLITFAVGGSLRAAIELIQKVKDFLDKNVGPIGDDIANGVSGFTDTLNSFVEESLSSLPFVDVDVPKLDVSADVDKLKNLELPQDFDADLRKLNDSIPDFKDVNKLLTDTIRIPFEKIKGLIGEAVGNYTFDRSVFPVPQKEELSFCTGSDGINDFFDGLLGLSSTARKVAIGVLVVLAVLVCAPMAWREIRRYRTMQRRALLVNQGAHDPMDVVYIASRPFTAGAGLRAANGFGSTRQQSLVRWAIAYATSSPALFVLSLGVTGLFACLCQLILLRAIQKEVPELTNQVGAFAEKVVSALNGASENWANGVNGAIAQTNDEINQEVFGWVDTATTSVNDTLNQFVDAMSEGLDKAFGGTPLREPIQEVLDCLITLKIEGIQKGLTWVHDNAKVSFPGLPSDTFSLGAVSSIAGDDSGVGDFLSAPGATTRDEISDAVGSVVDKFQSGIVEEAFISLGLIAVWLAVALGGAARALALFFGRGRTRAEGGQSHPLDPETAAAVASASRANLTAVAVARDFHQEDKVYRPESTAPPYEYAVNKAAPYTLQPRPFPVFEHSDEGNSNSNNNGRRRSSDSYDDEAASPRGVFTPTTDEKLGAVSHQHAVAQHTTSAPQHARQSSYGQVDYPYGDVSPVDEKSGHGSSVYNHSHNHSSSNINSNNNNNYNPFSLFRREKQ